MVAFVKSIRNHISLVLALTSILFSVQLYILVERSISAYNVKLKNNYSMIVMSKKDITQEEFLPINKLIAKATPIDANEVATRLSGGIKSINLDLLKLSLPKFYKVTLSHYPTPAEIKSLKDTLLKHPYITKVEDFSYSHDIVYKLLMLFKTVAALFAGVILLVTMLLIFKELRIWQYQHNERMSIMSLFGAPLWLRSAVLFRLAIVDAIISSVIIVSIFTYLAQDKWVLNELNGVGINIVIFDFINDSIFLGTLAVGISMLLAVLIIIAHKEEV